MFCDILLPTREGRGRIYFLTQFRGHELCLTALCGVLSKEIRKEEHLENGEDDEELYAYHEPQRSPERHRAKAIVIEVEGTVE